MQRVPTAARPMDKLSSAPLGEFRPHLALPTDAAALYDACTAAADALGALEAGGFLLEAARLLAHALPRREAVWWACMCSRHTAIGPPGAAAGEVAAACLAAAELWVRQANDENGRAAFAQAEAAVYASPEAWACVAAFWSGDSMAPLVQPAVPPARHFAGLAVAGAVTLASVRGRPEIQAQRLAVFIRSAREIAAGGTGRLEAEQS